MYMVGVIMISLILSGNVKKISVPSNPSSPHLDVNMLLQIENQQINEYEIKNILLFRCIAEV